MDEGLACSELLQNRKAMNQMEDFMVILSLGSEVNGPMPEDDDEEDASNPTVSACISQRTEKPLKLLTSLVYLRKLFGNHIIEPWDP